MQRLTAATLQVSNSISMTIFYQLEVVGRGSETQLQVGDKLIDLIQRLMG